MSHLYRIMVVKDQDQEELRKIKNQKLEGGKILQDTQILVVGKLLPPTLHFNLIFGWGTFLANICDGFLLVGLGWGGFDQDIRLDIFFCTSFLQVRYFRTLVYRWSNNCESCGHKLLHLRLLVSRA